MGIFPHTGVYGSQTVLGPAFPTMEEEELEAAAAAFEALALQLTGTVVPQLTSQQTAFANVWHGPGSDSAQAEASTIINGHEMNAAEASAIAQKLRLMEAVLVRTKTTVNMTAEETEQQCQEMMSQSPMMGAAAAEAQVAMGLAQNIETVSSGASELAGGLGVPTNLPLSEGGAGLAGATDPQQAMQMAMQMAQQAGQVPQQLSKAAGQGMQQLTKPLQQLTSMFGKMGSGSQGAKGSSPFSTHPLAGGSGPRSGAGLGRSGGGGGMPGSGGASSRTPLMSKLIDKGTKASATMVQEGAAAGGRVTGRAAPVGAGGGGAGGMGAMGNRGTSGGSKSAIAVPARLDHDLAEDDEGEDW